MRPKVVLAALLVSAAFMAGLLAQPLRSRTVAAAALPSHAAQPARAVAAAPVVHAVNNPQALTYQIDAQTLSAQANSWLAGQTVAQTPFGPATLDGITVQLQNGQMKATATATAGSVRMPAQMVATPEVQAGRVVVNLTDAELGSMSVPDGMRNSIQQSVQAQLDQMLSANGVSVESVTIDQGQLVIVANSR